MFEMLNTELIEFHDGQNQSCHYNINEFYLSQEISNINMDAGYSPFHIRLFQTKSHLVKRGSIHWDNTWFKLTFRFWSVRSGTRQPAPLRNPWSRPVQRDNLPILPEKGRIIHLKVKVIYLYGASVCLYILLCMSVSPFSLVKQFQRLFIQGGGLRNSNILTSHGSNEKERSIRTFLRQARS